MKAQRFIEILQKNDFSPIIGVPCSVFKNVLNYINDNQEIKHYICSSEGEAMGLAAGFAMSEKVPVVYMQNDGYGNVINPLSSLQLMNKLPALLMISWRAEPGTKDAPQHKIMGETILELLTIFKIPYKIIDDENTEESVRTAKDFCKEKSMPFALIVKKGVFEKYENKSIEKDEYCNRLEYLKILSKRIDKKDVLLGTTGFSGRELYETVDHKGKFYMMGSMGCLASIGLGIAESHPKRNVYVLDGDGALLMKMGTLSTVGFYEPKNLIHICFDNNKYESTGGQGTTSETTNYSQVARACGYKTIHNVKTPEEFIRITDNINEFKNPHFIHIRISTGTADDLPRPSATPEEMRDKIVDFLKK
jgi:phosphonopyruvate decarboxylase